MVRLISVFLLLFFASFIAGAQRTSKFPAPKGFVNDYEGDFAPDQVKELDYEVKALLAKTMDIDSLRGMEMAIVTVTDSMLGDENDMSNYVSRLGDKWGVSMKGDNKAIIIAYGKKVRRVSIVAGLGLDHILPPAVCRRIIDEKMTADFRRGDYFKAILTAIKSVKESIGLK